MMANLDSFYASRTPRFLSVLLILYVLALQKEGEAIGFPVEGFDGGTISMLTVQIG